MKALQVYLFHSLRVCTPDGVLLDLGSPTTRSLFAYFILNRSRPINRRSLAFKFWPDEDESSARRNLRIYLHHIRRALEGVDPANELLWSDNSSVQVNPQAEIWVDVEVFTQSARTGASLDELKTATSLYEGDLLDDTYSEWCQEERQHLRQVQINALARLVQGLKQLGGHEEAIRFAQKWITLEPYDEQAHRYLMALTAAAGDRHKAIQHYHSLVETLQADLGIAPMPETRALFESIQSASALPETASVSLPFPPPSPAAAASLAPHVGRDAELQLLEQTYQAGRSGRGGFLLVTGESGIGKTRLVQEYLSRHPGALVLETLCHELESLAAYAPLRAIIEQAIDRLPETSRTGLPAWLSPLQNLLPSTAQALPVNPEWKPPPAEQTQITDTVIRLIAALHAQWPLEPVQVILDDLHWVDGPTWDFLVMLGRMAVKEGVIIIGLCRLEDLGQERRRFVRLLERNKILAQIPLRLLTIDETSTLVREIAPDLCADPFFVQRLYKETEGNPFFIVEIVKAVKEDSLHSLSGRSAFQPDRFGSERVLTNLPLSIQQVIEARLDRLSPPSQELLKIAAVIGHPFTLAMLEEISQVSAEEAIHSFEEWLERGLVRENGQSYDFSHDEVRQVAYASLSHARRQYVHRLVGDVLENRIPAADPATLAYHFSRSDQPQRTLPFLIQAGEQALRIRSYSDAYQFGLQAVALLGRIPGPRQRAERVDLNLQLAQAYAFTGDLLQAREILNETEHLALGLEDQTRLGKIFYRSAQIFWLSGQPETAGDYARRSLRSAEEQRDSYLLQASLRMLGRVGIALSAFDDAIAYLLRYTNLENATPRLPDLPIILGYLGIAYSRVGSSARAYECARKGVTLAEGGGKPQEIAFSRMHLGLVAADHRNWQECLDILNAILDLPEPLASLQAGKKPPSDTENAPLTPLGFMLLGVYGYALVHLGRPEEGAQAIRAGLAWAEKTNYRVFHYLPRMFLADSLADAQAARTEAEISLNQAREAGNRWAIGVSLRLLAEIQMRAPGPNWPEIEDGLIESMQLLRQVRARPDLARTYLALRRLYDRAGQIAWAVDCHFRATTIYEELGLVDELRQAQGHAAGERRGAVVISGLQLRGPNTLPDRG